MIHYIDKLFKMGGNLSDKSFRIKMMRSKFIPLLMFLFSCYKVKPGEITGYDEKHFMEEMKEIKAVEVNVRGVTIDSRTRSPVVLLEDTANKRVLPIWIGYPEARAIAVILENVKDPRPMTHDLLVNILNSSGIKLLGALVAKVEENIFYAKLYLRTPEGMKTIDSRPSDAIAISLRTNTSIYVAEEVFENAESIPLPSSPSDETAERTGIIVQEITEEMIPFFKLKEKKGVLVSDVIKGSPGDKGGVKIGDVIIKINGKEIFSQKDYEEEVKKSKEKMRLEILREGNTLVLEVLLEGFREGR